MVVATRLQLRTRAAIAALAAVVLVGCTLLVAWHRATVTHGVCAEHGEEIHLERTAVDAPAPAPIDDASVFAGQFALEDGDHHCDQLATSAGDVARARARQLIAHVDAIPRVAAIPELPHAAVAVYRVAPKTSPPN